MGQGLSQPAQAVEEPSPPAVEAAPSSSPSPAPAPSSLEALAAEAMSFDEDGNEDASLSYFLHYFLAPWMISELSILCIQSIDVKCFQPPALRRDKP
uniref:Uncharacterized protein n=1 Tax=Oryza meridionalis TaxID=40149 RepID=A0A0E0DGF7_9ORYZ